jgi:adenylate cyclase
VADLSAQELAERVPCPPENVRRLEELGVLKPREDGRYSPYDVHAVRLMGAFEETGMSVEDIARGVSSGELFFPPMQLYLPEPDAASSTYEELAASLGRSPELVRRLIRELGLPPRDDDRVREEDAQMLSSILTKVDLADDEDLSRLARLYGGTMQRLVTSGIQFFDRTVRQRVETFDLSNEEKDRLGYEKAAAFTEVVLTLVPWLQRRHREHAVLDYLVGLMERWMDERGIAASQPKQPPAIAFLDLTGYTELAEERGDEAAAELAAGLAGVVQDAARTHGGRPVKWLGDGVMFHFDDPAGAVLSGLDLVEQTESALSVPARIGINAGAVIVQEGDYFGRTVNVAARIADYAGPHEVLVSEEARQSADHAEVQFELVGDVTLKGISRSVRLHRATRPDG